VRRVQRMLGGPFSQERLLSGLSGGSRMNSTEVGQISIAFPQTGRAWTEYDIARLIDARLERALGGR